MKRYRRNMTVTFATFLVGFVIMLTGAIAGQIVVEVAGGAVAWTGAITLLLVARRYNDYTRDEQQGQAR